MLENKHGILRCDAGPEIRTLIAGITQQEDVPPLMCPDNVATTPQAGHRYKPEIESSPRRSKSLLNPDTFVWIKLQPLWRTKLDTVLRAYVRDGETRNGKTEFHICPYCVVVIVIFENFAPCFSSTFHLRRYVFCRYIRKTELPVNGSRTHVMRIPRLTYSGWRGYRSAGRDMTPI